MRSLFDFVKSVFKSHSNENSVENKPEVDKQPERQVDHQHQEQEQEQKVTDRLFMTAMDVQPVSAPQPASVSNGVPPAPPPPPGCPGSFQIPHWRSEPLPAHLAPTKEQIDKEQYAHLPDKLLNAMNKDKKPFTYTPSGVSGNEKGKLDLSSIRSPRMKKRLLANLADNEEDSDQFDTERVTRSETPEVASKQKVENNRRAITPEISYNKQQMYAPVLPPKEMLQQRPVVQKYKSEEELEAYVQKQMKEMEETLKNRKNKLEPELEPEVKELIDSYKNVQQTQRTVPIEVETTQARPELSEQVIQSYDFTEPESTKPVVEQTMSYRLDYNRSPINEIREQPKQGNNGINNSSVNTNHRFDRKPEQVFNKNSNNDNNDSNPWDSDLLRHVLDGGLQEEIEKFEKISLETQNSFSNPKRNDTYYDRETTPTFETFGRSLPNPPPVWSTNTNSYQETYANRNQSPSPYGSLNRTPERNGVRNPKPIQSQTESISQSISSVREFWNEPRYWSESPVPSQNPVHHHYERETASVEPVYRGHDIPSNQYRQTPMTGYMPSEVPNYNSRPKPFYLCSPPSTPTPTPPPPSQFMSQPQPIQRPRDQQFTTFGKNIAPQKINYQNEISNSGYSYESSPQRKYIESSGMYAQITPPDEWERPMSPPNHRNIKFNDQVITTPDRSGFKSPEPPKPILKKKLPPSERPPDPTPPKYMGGNIPSRSFRVLQLMTGEDIDNQFIDNDFVQIHTKPIPKSKPINKTVSYSNYEDFGTDF